MNCETIRTLLNFYIDGETGELESRRISQHIKECASCAEEARQYRVTRDLVAEFGMEKAPAGLLNDIRIQLQKDMEARPVSAFRFRNAMALAASFLLVVAGGVYFGLFKTGNSGLYMDKAMVKMESTAPRTEVSLSKEKEISDSAATAEAGSVYVPMERRDEPAPAPAVERAEPALMAGANGLERSEPRPVMETARNIETGDSTYFLESADDTAPGTSGEIYMRSSGGSAYSGADRQPENIFAAAEPAPAPAVMAMLSDDEDNYTKRYDYSGDGLKLSALGAGDKNDEPSASRPRRDASSLRLDSSRSQANYVREEMRLALDEKDIELAAEAAAPQPEPATAYSMSALSPSHSYAPSPARTPAATPVAYGRTGQAGFDYYNVPSNADVISYFMAKNQATASTRREAAAPAGIASGNYVRSANIFFSSTPEAAAGDCQGFISEFIRNAADSQTAWRRNGNYFIVKGSFSTLAPLRVRLTQEFASVATSTSSMTNAQIVATASATQGIPSDYPAVLEVQFLQK